MARAAGRGAGATAQRNGGGARAAHVRAATRYVEAAFYLVHEGEEVRPGRLAEWLGVSAPTVSEALRRLERDGLVIIKDRPGSVVQDLERWAAARGIRTDRRRRALGRATHWEIRRS
jgi:Mn-dependent DtxR family transcriptional regulator